MQVKQELLPKPKDWHQQLLIELLSSPLVKSRVGSAFTSIGHLLKFNLTESFPVTTAKKLFFGQVKRELYCFLKGQTSQKDLRAAGVTIWDDDLKRAQANDIGPIYGYQWRKWPDGKVNGFDQLRFAIDELKRTNGQTRRAVVSAWNAPQVLSQEAVLPPCHVLFQFNIVDSTLYTDVYQRSADVFLGLPFDVASFAIMSKLVANELNWKADMQPITNEVLNYHISNLHLYKAHKEAAEQELSNMPINSKAWLSCSASVDSFQHETCLLKNYFENRVIKAPLLT
jgi:thymidylate synthase